MPARLAFESIEWQHVGSVVGADDPRNHLHASLVFGDANLHADAIEVRVNDHGIQVAVDDTGTHWLEGLTQLTGAFDILETVTIDGREYILVITPFAR